MSERSASVPHVHRDTRCVIVQATHYFTTVRIAISIIVLDDGQAFETGPHDPPMRTDG